MMTKEQMTQLLSDLTSGYGIRQILAILLIFLIGVFFLYGIREKIKTQWLLALAYPVGLALWCVAGFLLLTLGIRFCLFSELAMIALILAVSVGTAGFRYRSRCRRSAGRRRPLPAAEPPPIIECILSSSFSSLIITKRMWSRLSLLPCRCRPRSFRRRR